jgi:hypothetical protein
MNGNVCLVTFLSSTKYEVGTDIKLHVIHINISTLKRKRRTKCYCKIICVYILFLFTLFFMEVICEGTFLSHIENK